MSAEPRPILYFHPKESVLPRNKNRRTSPMDPVEIARLRAARKEAQRNPANWGANEEALRLASANDVDDAPETKAKVRQLQRYDVFSIAHKRSSITDEHLVAIRRWESDLACAHRVDGATPHGGRADREDKELRQITAANDMAKITAAIGHPHAKLLDALTVPTIIYGRRINWRAAVQASLGEHRPVQQMEAVKAMLKALVGSYEALDRLKGKERDDPRWASHRALSGLTGAA